jgi:hypothetical protein
VTGDGQVDGIRDRSSLEPPALAVRPDLSSRRAPGENSADGVVLRGLGRKREQAMPAMTLRRHLMALVLAVLLPMIAFSSIVIVAFGREQTAAVQRGAVGTARATMSAIDEYLTGSIRTLEALSALPSLDAGDLRQFHEDAARALSSQPPG